LGLVAAAAVAAGCTDAEAADAAAAAGRRRVVGPAKLHGSAIRSAVAIGIGRERGAPRESSVAVCGFLVWRKVEVAEESFFEF
jgi:hypothetical protein